jgi:single-stranded DNA-binding protein
MTAYVLVTGDIFRAAELKTGKSGWDFCTATIRSTTGTETEYWRIVAFGDAAIELARLYIGDSLSAQGRLKIENYEKNGERRVSLSVMANAVSALRAAPKAKAQKAPERSPFRGSSSTPETRGMPCDPYDDFPEGFGG